MDQFYISSDYTAELPPFNPIPDPIINPKEFGALQAQADHVQLATLVRSYISSIIVALRLHKDVISTSISARAVGDIRNLVSVLALRDEKRNNWVNAESVPIAVEMCVSFRLRFEAGVEDVTYKSILDEVVQNVRAPF